MNLEAAQGQQVTERGERRGGSAPEGRGCLNELLANNCVAPFLLRLDASTRLHAGNMLGRLLADMVPDNDLQALHDGMLPVSVFIGLQDAVRELATTEAARTNSLDGARRQAVPVLLETGE